MAAAAPRALIVGRLVESSNHAELVVKVQLSGGGQAFPVRVELPAAVARTAPALELGMLLGVIGTWQGEPPAHWIRATRLERLGGALAKGLIQHDPPPAPPTTVDRPSGSARFRPARRD